MDKVTKNVFINEDFIILCVFNIFLNKESNEINSTITQILRNSLIITWKLS